ncbi:MAG: ornithine cyclodeaminase family protein [Anaerolineae bacterium]|nr:MAG: ornithine cyclodeaminase family protein [Anaerolineae bacterium]
MKRAYAALSDGRAEVPLRARLSIPPHEAVSLFMPAYVQSEDGEALAVKAVSVFPHNPERGEPLIYAAVLVLQPDSGRPLALLEGGSLTAIRTGAGSGAAIDLLARAESRVVAIFGAGTQGRTQLEAACTVRRIETAWVYDPNRERAQAFVAEMAGRGPVPRDLRIAESPSQALTEADIICTATTSSTPVFDDADLKPGAHISAIGAYTPEMQEIPAATVTRARVVVDSRQAVLAEAGDLIQPMQQGLFDESHIYAELGEIVLGRKAGRQSPEEITLFKSVGVAVQDAFAAQVALRNADTMGIGQVVSW